ncbi:hypothetical protein ACFLWR_04760 [Chloroflexota bacterium]
MKMEVVYLCWNCGSQMIKIEEVTTKLPLPYLEQWNVCPECLADSAKNNSREQG